MRAVWLMPQFAFGISLITSGHLFAQPLIPRTESIDSLVANSDYVLVAKLVDFQAGADDQKGHDATIAIEESLKHPVLMNLHRRMSFRFSHPRLVLGDWKKHSCRLLVAFDEYAKETTVIDLSPGKVEVLTADFLLLRKPEAVIDAAKQAVQRVPVGVKRVHTFKLHVPGEIVAGTKWEPYYKLGGHLVLNVPVDERLKKRAREYVQSKKDRLKHYEGEQALRYFRTDEN